MWHMPSSALEILRLVLNDEEYELVQRDGYVVLNEQRQLEIRTGGGELFSGPMTIEPDFADQLAAAGIEETGE